LELIKKCFIQSSITEKGESLKSVTSRSGELKLSHIFLYPIKSCGAQNVLSWPLDARGLIGDRAWMIATDTGIALTQKHEPKMCLIKPCLDINSEKLTLSFPGKYTLP
jgi:molybdenum cofactor sulfurtransferase